MKLKFPNFVLATLALFTLDGCYQAPAESQAPTDAAIQTLRSMKETPIVCNEFGVAYYKQPSFNLYSVYIPVFKNSTEVATCDDIVKGINR